MCNFSLSELIGVKAKVAKLMLDAGCGQFKAMLEYKRDVAYGRDINAE